MRCGCLTPALPVEGADRSPSTLRLADRARERTPPSDLLPQGTTGSPHAAGSGGAVAQHNILWYVWPYWLILSSGGPGFGAAGQRQGPESGASRTRPVDPQVGSTASQSLRPVAASSMAVALSVTWAHRTAGEVLIEAEVVAAGGPDLTSNAKNLVSTCRR